MSRAPQPADREGLGHAAARRRSVLLISLVAATLALAAWATTIFTRFPGRGRSNVLDQSDVAAEGNGPSRLDAGLGSLHASTSQRQWRDDDAQFSPESDGWESESFALQAKAKLQQLTRLLTQTDAVRAEDLSAFASDDYLGQPLRPPNLREVVRDKVVTVWREESDTTSEVTAEYRGVRGLARSLSDLSKPLSTARDVQIHVKIHAVALTPTSAKTTVDFEAHGRVNGGTIQQNATWLCDWSRRDHANPKLTSIRVTSFEEVLGRAPQATWFTDCTESVLERNDSFRQQLGFGLNHYLRRIERVHGMQVYARTGLAVGDVNGDGLDDLYLCQPGGLPNRLYIQNPDGTATDRSQAAGVDWLEETHGALLVDLDNDGDQDLALACTAGICLMENDARGVFRVRARLSTERSIESLSAVDFDNDGDLDLYNCVYRPDPGVQHEGSADEFLYHDANNGGVNRMFRNDIVPSDQWQFVDVTEACGLDQDNRRWSLAASWEDFDNDGDQDLYVANDYGQNCLYRNDDGQFVNVADAAGVVDFGSGMSVSWADFNHDGWMDLYVGNMYSSAGNRIAGQGEFMSDRGEGMRRIYRRFAKGNSLFTNLDGRRFRESGAEAAVEMGRWAWSSVFADINNDGWDDLLVANGFITADDHRDL